jgi:hypothetical protein
MPQRCQCQNSRPRGQQPVPGTAGRRRSENGAVGDQRRVPRRDHSLRPRCPRRAQARHRRATPPARSADRPKRRGKWDAAAAAIWRIENARLATLPLGVLASYRTLAVAAGLGAMLLAIGVWFVGAGEPTMKGGASEPSAARTTASPGSSASPRVVSAVSGAPVSGGASSPGVRAVSALSGSSAPEVQSHAAPAAPPTIVAAPVSAAPSVAPRIAPTTGNGAAPLPPAAATTDATSSERAVPTPRGEPAQPPRPASSQPANARAATLASATGRPPAAAVAAASSRRPGPAAANGSAPDSASDDMLDLFGDPK